MSDHDDQHDDDAPLGRRRFLRLSGVTGLALASATLLTACPGQREDEGGDGEDGSGEDVEEDGGADDDDR